MKKVLKKLVSGILALSAIVMFSGCEKVISAYDIATKNGFNGTETEWLESLKGRNGEDAKSPSVNDLYEEWTAQGNEGTFSEFLHEYLTINMSEDTNTETIAHNLNSVVGVYCGFEKTTTTGRYPYFTQKTGITSSAGSGVVLNVDTENGNATIVTNFHVVYDASADGDGIAKYIYLYTYGGRIGFSSTEKDNKQVIEDKYGCGIKAEYFGGSMQYDIAVLTVQSDEVLKKSTLEKAVVGDSDKVVPGQKVFAVGNAEGEGISVTAGWCSVDSENIDMTLADEKTLGSFRVMRTDAAINHGNSGGGLFDSQGRLIGITNAKSVKNEVDNIGYALPISQSIRVVKNILDNGGTFSRALMGVTVQPVSSSGTYDPATGTMKIVEKVQITELTETGLANGQLIKGDVIKSIKVGDGETVTVTRQYQLLDQMLDVRKGDKVTLTVERVGISKTVEFMFDDDANFLKS